MVPTGVGRAYGTAGQAFELALVLALEQADNDAVVSPEIDVPLSFSGNRSRENLQLCLSLRGELDWRGLVCDEVEVFMKSIEQKGEELLAIVLVRPFKLGRKAADCVSERDGREERVLLRPECLHELRNRMRQYALCPQHIGRIDGLLVASLSQKPGERDRCAEALHHRIHVAGIAQVLQASEANEPVPERDQLRREAPKCRRLQVRGVLQQL